MHPDNKVTLLKYLQSVAVERQARVEDPSLGLAANSVKQFQHERFRRTYSDLLSHPRYQAAAGFFLDELYGPHDFSERDAQFERIVPALVRMFPQDVVDTVRDLAELHAITEQMDSRMARCLAGAALHGRVYVDAWVTVGGRETRERQVELMMNIGSALDRYTRRHLLGQTLRLMRGPARLSGLGALQNFLEVGFDTFRGMHGAEEFLAIIAGRERALIDDLFAVSECAPPLREKAMARCLVQLP